MLADSGQLGSLLPDHVATAQLQLVGELGCLLCHGAWTPQQGYRNMATVLPRQSYGRAMANHYVTAPAAAAAWLSTYCTYTIPGTRYVSIILQKSTRLLQSGTAVPGTYFVLIVVCRLRMYAV